VALTANASEEDRSRYLACGMDAFLTKPIDEVQLHYHLSRAIERQLQRGIELPLMTPRMVPHDTHAQASTPSTAELDAMFGVVSEPLPLAVVAAQNVGRRAGDLKGRMRAAFAADLPRRRAELDAALAAGDRDACGRLLHGMRGSAGYLGDAALRQLCGELEREADGGDLERVAARMPELLGMLARFEEPMMEVR
jgi:HPt (histidine-containing phosphotransfer) domain-containing protein